MDLKILTPHPLTNFEIQAYYHNDPRLFDVYSRDNLPHQEILVFIACKDIITSIYRIQSYDSIMCGYFCIGFINYMFMGKSLADYTNIFSPNNFKKNDSIILNYFLNKL